MNFDIFQKIDPLADYTIKKNNYTSTITKIKALRLKQVLTTSQKP